MPSLRAPRRLRREALLAASPRLLAPLAAGVALALALSPARPDARTPGSLWSGPLAPAHAPDTGSQTAPNAAPKTAPKTAPQTAPKTAAATASATIRDDAERSARSSRPAAPGPDASPSRLCEAAIATAARRHDVPARLLTAVALTESGRAVDGRRRPWPWTVNGAGAGYWLDDRAAGLALTDRFAARKIASYDVGCMQLNRRWHGQAFATVADMFDPVKNVDYAARFLKALAAETGDWIRAAGLYHSRTPALAKRYREKVAATYAKLDGRLAAPPPPEHAPRPDLRAAKRPAEPLRAASIETDVALARRAHARFGLVGASGPLLREASKDGLLRAGRPLFDPEPNRGGLFQSRPTPSRAPDDASNP